MFFWLSKYLAIFTVPLTYVFLLLAAALVFFRHSRWSKGCLLATLVILLITGTTPVPNQLLRWLETHYERPAALPHADAVIVLTGMVDLRGSSASYIELTDGAERFFAGLQLMQQGYGDVLIISGGSGDPHEQGKSEAAFLRQFAIELGFPPEQLLVDTTSRNTYENAVNTRAILEEHHLSTSILVTSASHLPRAMGCFHKLGLKPVPYPVDFRSDPAPRYSLLSFIPGIQGLYQTEVALHEYVGILMYWLVGYL